ncbi:barstar family protein [Actinoplanes solisilvae]
MHLQLDGNQIRTEADFHRHLAALLDFGPFHGRKLDTLWTG